MSDTQRQATARQSSATTKRREAAAAKRRELATARRATAIRQSAKTPGGRLAAYIYKLIPKDQSVNSWCEAHGVDPQRLSAWRTKGGSLKIESAKAIADGLNLTLGQVLIIAGYVKPSDFDGAMPPAPAPPPPPTVPEAIERDPALTDDEREVLRNVVEMFTKVRSGRGGTRRGKT